ncbi:MAG: hypothetical protein AAGA43_02055 [Bacteroidota bacterium]
MASRIRITKPSLRTIIDIVLHYVVAVWILVLFYFLLDLQDWFTSNSWLICAAIALLIVPIRILALYVLKEHDHSKYIKKIMDELVNNDS